jgi:hypothetical protein
VSPTVKPKSYLRSSIILSIFVSLFALVFPLSIFGQTNTVTTYSFITKWGSLGENDGQFDGQNDVDFYDGRVYVADYANHRIQIFDPQGNVYVADYGNDRIQKFTNDGKSL